jgi:hypothetical protein
VKDKEEREGKEGRATATQVLSGGRNGTYGMHEGDPP